MDEKPKKKTSSAKIDKEVLTDSIVDALIKYDEKKKEIESKEYYKKETNEKLGFGMILKMLWSPRKYLNTQGANETIFKGLIKFIYKTFEWVLLICSLLLLVYIPAQFIFSSLKIVEWWVDVLYVCGAFCGILISRVFRILAIDIERTKDKNFMITLLSVIIALISIVIVIVK